MERPILMRTESVKAILEGRKTQTRRVIKPQPTCSCDKPDWHGQIIDWVGWKYEGREGWFCYTCGSGLHAYDEWSSHGIICPYGQVGDRLWLRESFGYLIDNKMVYRADCDPWHLKHGYTIKWRPSIFMPRWASRITLEITEIRVERVQEIDYFGARAEGILSFNREHPDPTNGGMGYNRGKEGLPMRYDSTAAFMDLWDSINGKKYPWESNPFCWVITFKHLV